ncbi:BON domain-containing protein [Cupriavidus numazuensis]|uniref:BON domain-containing protein n=1 Tax=Cupriavidus numazuensis TaxID=221992 RepID=A0ABM8TPI6_9BURK|nr:hypothetical protein LMG26411_05516 [Cupriavidus numazuensis]
MHAPAGKEPRECGALCIWGLAFLLALLLPVESPRAEAMVNYGNDPFMQVSSRIAGCPEPTGPRVSEAEWRREAHHRIEQGNHCWTEGRCRLANAFQYDKEIAESLQRRLRTLAATMPAWQDSTLWITVRGRWLTVQGCVRPGFAKAPFMDALREVPDVEKVVDQTTAFPARNLPYTRFVPGSSRAGEAASAPSAGSR